MRVRRKTMRIDYTPEMYANDLEQELVNLVRERARPQLIDEIRKLWHEVRKHAGMPTT